VIVVGIAAWFLVPARNTEPQQAAATAPAADATAAPSAAQPNVAPPEPPSPTPVEPPASSAAPPKTAPSAAQSRASTTAAAANASHVIAPSTPVARKPGETVQAWRERGQALQARYAYSKVALDRGDFAAAAGGFAAILLEEPGYLDAPQLLVKARDGLRAAAHDALDAGNRLDAAGDWISALRKFDQAREIDAATPGLDDAVKRVKEKMRVAGNDALKRARQYDALGRPLDALKEYEKAAQWLPAEDPNREAARTRADQLKAGIK
jgi:tetratricopeptide (TPR) repeat protein